MFKTNFFSLINQKLISENKNKKPFWTPRKMIFWGFNIIAGYTFLITLGQTYFKLGNFLPLVLILSSFIAFVSGIAFGRLSSHYGKNGGTLIFARHAFGKKIGGLMGFFQIMQLPIVSAIFPLSTVWLFNGLSINKIQISDQWYMYVLGMLLLGLISIIPIFNFTSNKVSLTIMWTFKWIVVIFSIVLCLSQVRHFSTNIINGYKPTSSYNYFLIIQAIITFFFAFGGFEVIGAQAEDIENSKTKILTIILTVIIMVAVFYLFYYFLILGALGPNGKAGSTGLPAVSNDNRIGNNLNKLIAVTFYGGNMSKILGSVIGVLIIVLVLITQFSSKISARLQYGWSNSRIIEAYATAGYLPSLFANKSKYHKSYPAFLLDIFITMTLALFFVLISFFGKFLISGAIDIVSYISFMQYLGALIAIMCLKFKNKKFKVNFIELILYIIVSCTIILLLFSYMIGGFINFVDYFKTTSNNRSLNNLSIGITSLFLVVIFIVGITLVACSFIFKWDKNNVKQFKNKNDSNISDSLDNKIDDIIGHDSKTEGKGVSGF